MRPEWAVEVYDKLHTYSITVKELSKEAGYHPKYAGWVLNGNRASPTARAYLEMAVERLIEKRVREKRHDS